MNISISALFYENWKEARTRFSNQIIHISASDLSKKVSPIPNSVGFLIRHIADVELLFAKNVFGATSVSVSAKTVIQKQDSGEWTDLEQLRDYTAYAFEKLGNIILAQGNEDWENEIETKEFGKKTKAEALGRIISHTAYHAGQMASILKYGH